MVFSEEETLSVGQLQLLTELIIYTTDKSSTKWKLAANSRHSKR